MPIESLLSGTDGLEETTVLENKSVSSIELVGKYEVIISEEGDSYLPSLNSLDDYIAVSVPQGFNMTIKLSNASNVKLVTDNMRDEVVGEGKIIRFNAVKKNTLNPTPIQLIMKSPEIKVIDGKSIFEHLHIGEFNPYLVGNHLGERTEFNGNLTLKVSHVDKIDIQDGDRRRIKYITFLSSLEPEHWEMDTTLPSFKFPGEIPEALGKMNIDPIWKRIIISQILALASISSITIILVYLHRRRKF